MNLDKKRFLIIGGTGFIGFFIAKKLLEQKNYVSILSTSKPSKFRKITNAEYLIGNVQNLKKLKQIFQNRNYDYVINSCGYVEHFNKKRIHETHFKGCVNLYKIFKKKKLKKFIQIGSSAEYGNIKLPHKEMSFCKPKGYYGRTKLKATKFFLNKFKKNQFPICVVRLYQVYGPKQSFDRFIPMLIRASILKKKLNTSNGKQLRDFLYISDVVDAILKTIKSKKTQGKIINIGYGKSIPLINIINYIAKKLDFFSPIFGKINLRKDESLNSFPDIKRAKKLINWTPKIYWKKGILMTIKYYKKTNVKN